MAFYLVDGCGKTGTSCLKSALYSIAVKCTTGSRVESSRGFADNNAHPNKLT